MEQNNYLIHYQYITYTKNVIGNNTSTNEYTKISSKVVSLKDKITPEWVTHFAETKENSLQESYKNPVLGMVIDCIGVTVTVLSFSKFE